METIHVLKREGGEPLRGLQAIGGAVFGGGHGLGGESGHLAGYRTGRERHVQVDFEQSIEDRRGHGARCHGARTRWDGGAR